MCQATFVLAIIFLVHHDLSSARQISSSFNKQQGKVHELIKRIYTNMSALLFMMIDHDSYIYHFVSI
jgi:hypothetical protein